MSTEFETGSRGVRRRAGWQAVRIRDLLALAAVPLALIGVFALPTPVRRSLVFEYGQPSPVTAAVSPYVHLEQAHLLVNLGGYVFLAGVAYALAVASGHRRRFFAVFVTFVVAFPPVLSYANLAVPRHAYGFGFSGVVLAFVGYLPIGIADVLEERFGVGPCESLAPSTFFFGLALAAALSLRSVVPANTTVTIGAVGLVVASLLCALLFWLGTRPVGHAEVLGRLAAGPPGTTELLAVAVVLFVGMQFVAFPGDPARNGGVVNLYVHVIGYALGFLVVYATRHVEAGLSAVRPTSRASR